MMLLTLAVSGVTAAGAGELMADERLDGVLDLAEPMPSPLPMPLP